MPVAAKIAALFAALTVEELNAMPPAARRRFAQLCRHWAGKADTPDKSEPKATGVLAQLREGAPRHE